MMDMMPTDRRDVNADVLDMINKMDMMPKDRRDVHTETFRHDEQDD